MGLKKYIRESFVGESETFDRAVITSIILL